MPIKPVFLTLATAVLSVHATAAQEARVQKVGVISPGGSYRAVVDGLRDGLNQAGFIEGKRYVLDIREMRGALKSAEEAATSLEQQNVPLIYTVATSVTLAAKRATIKTPIVFFAGTDPVAVKLVESIRHPGGRLTGVYNQIGNVTGKRLELLKEIVPNLHRVITFYNPANPSAIEAVTQTKDAARVLGVELIERPVASAEQLRIELQAFRAGEADAYFAVNDATTDSQIESIIEMTKAQKLPSMFYLLDVVAGGGLASYSPDFREGGLLTAPYVRKILEGSNPADLPIEQSHKLMLEFNLKTAKEIGLDIPESILIRADKVIE